MLQYVNAYISNLLSHFRNDDEEGQTLIES
jgi:hypothetical protein